MPLILVVEDDEDNLELVTRFLQRQGYRVVRAADGVSGVKTAEECLPDLILMDLGLPGLDGREAPRLIRANPAPARIPIIALTAHAMSEHVNRAVEVRMDAYETKPVKYERLMRKIATFVTA